MEHETHKTLARRANWSNLRAHIATRSAVIHEGAETRRHVADAQESVTRAVVSAREALGAQIDSVAETISTQAGRAGDSSDAARDFAFFMRLDGLRALELKELLSTNELAAVGKKRTMVELAGRHLTQSHLDAFIAARSGKRARAAQEVRSGQATLDATFAAQT